ncbi:MAG: DJ-1/PfpI family protein [Candidatus Omnitrophota bacterium]|nr:DJ-1/PfpI family protein [Candidatus Omnitrophota bacterium]
MKKAVMIIAPENFRDEELFEPKGILEKCGVEVKIASANSDLAVGKLGAKVRPDMLIKDIRARDFDAVVFVGGIGASRYFDDQQVHNLVKEALKENRIVAAICIAPIILARAGVLKDKRATVFSSEEKEIRALGVKYSGRPVEKDGNIITAAGPFAATEFGREIAKALEE